MEMEWSRSWGGGRGRRSLEGKKLWRPSSLVCPRHDSDTTDSAAERGTRHVLASGGKFRETVPMGWHEMYCSV